MPELYWFCFEFGEGLSRSLRLRQTQHFGGIFFHHMYFRQPIVKKQSWGRTLALTLTYTSWAFPLCLKHEALITGYFANQRNAYRRAWRKAIPGLSPRTGLDSRPTLTPHSPCPPPGTRTSSRVNNETHHMHCGPAERVNSTFQGQLTLIWVVFIL
jgi:hypothetical protein